MRGPHLVPPPMSIAATELSVLHYRSFDDRKIELDPGITVLVGRNAVGKTNLVEALQLLTAGASFRKPTASELLRDGEGSGRIRLMLEGEGRLIEMGLDFSEGKRSFTRNGRRPVPRVSR
ncbi:MAG: AAA family ATPase [Collinsella intestinalis]